MNSTLYFKNQIDNIRKEALELGFSIKTMDGYKFIWNTYMKWKNESNFYYNGEEYTTFLLEHYNFDVLSYSSESKSRFQQLMRSKRILDDFEKYKKFMEKRMLPNSLYSNYPDNWNLILDKFLDYCKEIKQNSGSSLKIKNLTKDNITTFINDVVTKGEISKRRNFYVLREFLNYLFIEEILFVDLSIYVPKIKKSKRIKIPVYLKADKIEELLNNISKETKIGIRDYVIILLAARLGLRISDILNIKLKDIDWKHNKINIIQNKTNNLNILPLTNEIGWAIIDYIKNSRPKCENEYLFVKMKYPFDKMTQFTQFNKYFDKVNVKIEENNKKGIHNLRHSLATNMLEEGIPLNIIASTLGDTLQTTSNTYLKVSNVLLKQCALEVYE